jgi:S-adenosylmethionine uptake transporter
VSAVAYLQLKSLGKVNEPEWRTVLYFGLTATVTGLLYSMTWGEFRVLKEIDELTDNSGLLHLLALGFFGGAGNLALTRSFGSGSTWLSASLQYTTILFSTGFGIYLFGDTPKPGTWLGIAFIIACGALSTWVTRLNQLRK